MTENPFDSLATVLATSSADWSKEPDRAWVWGIIIGWDDIALAEIAKRFHWSPDTVARLWRLREAFREAQ